MKDEYDRIKSKINYFSNNFLPVHISKSNGWLNGRITKVTDDFIGLEEFKDGYIEVFIVDIKEIEQFKPPIFRLIDKEESDGTRTNN